MCIRDRDQTQQVVQTISTRVFRGIQDPTEEIGLKNRDGFVLCNGHVKIARLLSLELKNPDHESNIVTTINDCFHVLTELVMCMGHSFLDSLCGQTHLICRLFDFMAHKHTLDTALALAQEILAADHTVFSLEHLPDLAGLVEGLPPRRLALFCRILAVVLSKPSESLVGGIPAPECVPPLLCDSCNNSNLLVNLPLLLPRIVKLLKMARPPNGLWGEPWMASLPIHGGQHHVGEQEDTWESLSEPSATSASHDQVTVLLLASQVGPQLMELVAPLATQMNQESMGGVGLQLPQNNQVQWLQLSALESTLWSTLQGDVLYVCLLYTSDAADEEDSVDLGGRRIIKKKKIIVLV
eukprot:TRINITY_DN30597_c0_g1_i1.p1 TRINITY_DN30597_c0_g1~~TRINITY_DN30597_c0_g1_i1.p1  ORF type:complete len:353 (+),score=109.61 TRINITY_DN30597_c0_g1_i1:176-1234(+)